MAQVSSRWLNLESYCGRGTPTVGRKCEAGLAWTATNCPDATTIVTVPGDTPFIPDDLVSRLTDAGAVAVARTEEGVHPVVGYGRSPWRAISRWRWRTVYAGRAGGPRCKTLRKSSSRPSRSGAGQSTRSLRSIVRKISPRPRLC
ncbi:MAG: NTP transferase domain-containing protein [Methyloceanibacter sp.]|nr:NTP transferase domain-containing protein [Methyloceanibacter sp.]